jgi:hypothetical protein
VGDFGVARLAEGSSDGAGATVVGTPRYMAPEQSRGRPTTPATDVYSAGIVLYEMIAGRPPFTERAAVELALRHLRDRPPPLPLTTPAPLAEIVDRALAKAPHRRFADGAEMARALSVALAQAPARPTASRERVRTRSQTPARARSLISAGGRRATSPGMPPTFPARGRGPAAPAPTRRAPHRGPRRNLNPAARRRSVAALAAAFLLLGAMIVAALAIGATGHVRVPRVLGLGQARIEERAHALALRPSFTWRHSPSPRGIAIAQRPAPGRVLAQGATVHIVLSAGPPPVRVPRLAGQPITAVRAALSRLGLRSRVTAIAAPGVPAGAVTSQSPAPGANLARSGVVALEVAETPHWQPLAALHGSAGATRARFHVRGTRWRLVYTMAYQGTCTFVVVCSGPTATVDTGPTTATQSFDLTDSGHQTRTFTGGPGDYALTIAPGSDTARWSAWLEDWY